MILLFPDSSSACCLPIPREFLLSTVLFDSFLLLFPPLYYIIVIIVLCSSIEIASYRIQWTELDIANQIKTPLAIIFFISQNILKRNGKTACTPSLNYSIFFFTMLLSSKFLPLSLVVFAYFFLNKLVFILSISCMWVKDAARCEWYATTEKSSLQQVKISRVFVFPSSTSKA